METTTTNSPFADALRADMEALRINPRILGQRLGITQQAVDKWIRRGFPPPNRINELVETLGRGGAVASLTPEQMYGASSADAADPPLGQTLVYGVREAAPRPYVAKPTAFKATDAELLRRTLAQAEKEFGSALPTDLYAYTLNGRGRMAGLSGTIRLDYASPKLLLDIKARPVGVPHASSAQTVLRLLAAREVLARRDPGAPPPRMALALVSNMPKDALLKTESHVLAAQLGVEIWVCASGTEVAALVCEAEGYEYEPLEGYEYTPTGDDEHA